MKFTNILNKFYINGNQIISYNRKIDNCFRLINLEKTVKTLILTI